MNFVKKFSNCLSNEDCNDIIEYYLNNDFKVSQKREANLNYSVKEVSLNIINNQFWKNKFELIKERTDKNLRDYLSFNTSCGFDSYYFNHITIMHHQEMFNIPYHYDCEIEKIRNKTRTRVFAILLYLNNNFEGGELIFPVQNEIIKPEPGLMVVFPTSFMYPHVTTPSIGNDRYVLRLNYYVNEKNFI